MVVRVLLLCGLLPVSPALADPLSGSEPASKDASIVAETREYLLRTFPRRLWRLSRETFAGPPLLALAAAGALVPILDDHDEGIQEDLRRRRPLGDAAEEAGEVIGLPQALFFYPVAVAATGWMRESTELAATGATMLEALSLAGVSTTVLKLAVRRERPDGSNRLSFPSNHASGSFALATVVAGRHGWRPGIPAFLLAGFVSASRLTADKHFLTDTLFGAALGTAIGVTAARLSRADPPAPPPEADPADSARPLPPRWTISPFALDRGGGLAVLAAW